MYKVPEYKSCGLRSVDKVEGETIEQKVERIMSNKEPIKDGAPLIYTDRKDGILAAYNIRTDRWEVAAQAMDVVHKQAAAKRDGKAKPTKAEAEAKKDEEAKAEMKVEKGGGDSEAKTIQTSGEQ